MKERDKIMGTLAILFMYAIIIGVVSVALYFVIKMAVKDALKEYNNEKEKQDKNKKEVKKQILIPMIPPEVYEQIVNGNN